MTEEKSSITCEIICDLMVVYASGEASEETVRFIEEHLPECPECQEAYEAAVRGEDLLEELTPVERPIHIDGKKILLRFQRIFFGLVILLLLGAVLSIAVFERLFIVQILGIPLPQLYVLGGLAGGAIWIGLSAGLLAVYAAFHYWRNTHAGDPGSPYLSLVGASLLFAAGLTAYKFMVQGDLPGTIIAGMLTFATYIFMLRWRSRQESERFFGELLMSVEASVPLFILILATLTLFSAISLINGIPALVLLAVALLFTLIQLGELPYFSLVTIGALLVGGFMLIGNALGGFAGLLDLTLQWPAELGHPREVEVISLSELGYEAADNENLLELNDIPLGPGSQGVRTRYLRPGEQPVFISIIRFEDPQQAGKFIHDWERRVDNGFYAIHLDLSSASFNNPDGRGDHPLRWDLELPGVWFGQEGQIVRAYNENSLSAFNAWQVDEWVTIVEARGGVAQALPRARMIRELISESYH